MRPVLADMLTGLLVSICACAGLIYTGDGKLHDAGPFAAIHRYTIDIAPINLSQPGTSTYYLSGLPPTALTVGLDLVPLQVPTNPLYDTKPLNSTVTIEMTNERDEPVISAGGALSTWRWSYWSAEPNRYFLYREGEGHEIPVRPGVTTGVRDGQLADAGRGTSFTPRLSGRYKVNVTVANPDPAAAQFRVKVWVEGGGWN